MAERPYRVELTPTFLERLEAIESFLIEADAGFAHDRLLEELRTVVTRNLARFPRIGRRYLDQPPQSAEALALLAQLPPGAAEALREYLHGDYLILFAAAHEVVYLLSIRHGRQFAYAFGAVLPDKGQQPTNCLALREAHCELNIPIGHFRPDRAAHALVEADKAVAFHRPQGARQIARGTTGDRRQGAQ